MGLIERIDSDLRASLLAKDKLRTSTLRSLKSAITYATIESGTHNTNDGLSDEAVMSILAREAKKRNDSAEAFIAGGAELRAKDELAEKSIIEEYLPEPISDEELNDIIDNELIESGVTDTKSMGKIIGAVKAKVGSRVDGARLAQVVKKILETQ